MTLRGVTTNLISGGRFRPDGLPLSRTFGNGLADIRVYDTQGQLRELYLGSADTRLFSYDPNGNLTGKQTLPELGAYTYDTLNRLNKEVRTTQASTTTNWTYDANGNRKSQNTGAYAYLANSNRLTTAPGGAISLDAAGNTVSDGLRSYTYNNAGQLSHVAGASYAYNAQRLRSRKIVGSQGTVYHYDLSGNPIQETDVSGKALCTYIWADSQPLAQVDPVLRGGRALPPRLPGARLPAQAMTEVLTFLHTDHLGTLRLATDPQGKVIWRWEGTAFGDTYPNEDVDGDGKLTTVNLRFPGQYYDSESGLHYNWNRYYDPKIGRYITSDPIGLYYPNGLNPFVYGANNPLYWADPWGLNNVHYLPPWFPGGSSVYPNVVVVTNDYGIPVSIGTGSTKPDDKMPNCVNKDCPQILPGTYPFKLGDFPRTPRPNTPQIPALLVGDDGTVPTIRPNPNNDNKNSATGVWMHPGFRERTFSEGCLTLDPKYWADFMKKAGSSGDVTVW